MSPAAERIVEVERRVPGSPEAAFDYFTDPAKHLLWQGIRVDLDPRPGGAYIVHFNERSRVRGEYVVVEPHERIVLAWGWESADEFPPGTPELPPRSTTVEISFIRDGDATIVRVRHSGLPTERSFDFTTQGWGVYLDRLRAALSHDGTDADPLPAYLAVLPRTPSTR